jgi:hypothetical protein
MLPEFSQNPANTFRDFLLQQMSNGNLNHLSKAAT